MKRRRKKKSYKAEVQIPFPKMLTLCLVCATVLGLTYVKLCACCTTLGEEIKQLESEYASVQKQAIIEQNRWSNMLAPVNLERTLEYHNLKMALPDDRQVVRIRRGRSQQVMTLAYNKPRLRTD